MKARVTSIIVISPSQVSELERDTFTELPEEHESKKRMETLAIKCLDQVKTIALAQDVSCDVLYLEHDHPYQAIIDAANKHHCDLIVMAFDRLDWQMARLRRREFETAARFADEGAAVIAELAAMASGAGCR
jgi:nucleotide-binding universal stress UspA family protein